MKNNKSSANQLLFPKNARGFFLLELLIIVTLFAVMGLAVAKSSMLAQSTTSRAMANSAAAQQALSMLESFTSLNPATLSSANNSSTTLTQGRYTFRQVVSIAVNSDTSRTITVTVTGSNGQNPANISVSNTLAPW